MAAPSFDIKRLFHTKAIFWIWLVVGLVADLGSKIWAESSIMPTGWQPGQTTPVIPVIEGVFAWKWAVNLGAAFSILHGQVALLATIGSLALIGMVFYVYKLDPSEKGLLVGLGLVASGAVGNVSDRIRFGWVRDFMYFDFDLPFHDSVGFIPQRYPVFNVADISILVGAVFLVVASYQHDKRKAAEAAEREAQPA